MARTYRRSKEIRDFIIDNLPEHPHDIAQLTMARFEASRQAISAHLQRLVDDGVLIAYGRTRGRYYQLRDIVAQNIVIDISTASEEDVVWRDKVYPLIAEAAPQNVIDICQYGLTEMLNNVIDHSESNNALVRVRRNAAEIEIDVGDKGVGIFNKIQQAFNLYDPRHALLELSKGKLTTDQDRHTGEGVFFTSRIFDQFAIRSGALYFSRQNKEGSDDWLIEVEDIPPTEGTWIRMLIGLNATQTRAGIYDSYVAGDGEFSFTRTHVPLRLALYEGEKLVSRSQARRLLARIDRFKEALLDFKGVTDVGHSFIDEIFRVYKQEHPDVEIMALAASPEIQEMIYRARFSFDQPRLFDLSDQS